MKPARLRFTGIFNRRLGWMFVWTTVVIGAAVAVNMIGIRLVGDIEGWRHWVQANSRYFLVWRLCLYGATAYGWRWMRKRLRQREPSTESRRRLLRTEIAIVAAIALLEARSAFG
jgi:hypothetical protein